jgi:hypothetical protein
MRFSLVEQQFFKLIVAFGFNEAVGIKDWQAIAKSEEFEELNEELNLGSQRSIQNPKSNFLFPPARSD